MSKGICLGELPPGASRVLPWHYYLSKLIRVDQGFFEEFLHLSWPEFIEFFI